LYAPKSLKFLRVS